MPPWPQLLAVTRCRSCVDLDVCASPVSPPSVPSSIRASSALCAAASRPVFVILRRGGRPEPQVRAGRAPGSELTSLCCEIEFQTSNGPPLPPPSLCAPAAGWRGSCSLELQLPVHRGPIGTTLFSCARCCAEPSIHPASSCAAPEAEAEIGCVNALRLGKEHGRIGRAALRTPGGDSKQRGESR